MKRTAVFGSLSFDRIMNFPGLFKDHFLPEGLHNINVSFAVGAPKVERGGCAGNVSYSLALLETPSDILGCAGSDFAPYNEELLKNGIGVTTLQTYENLPTSSAYIMTDTADNQITAFSEGAGGEPYQTMPELTEYELAIIGPCAAINMHRAAKACTAAGLRYFFDPGQQIPALAPEVLRECIAGAAALFVNDYELALILEKTGLAEADILSRVEFIAVTFGEAGSAIRTQAGETRITPVKANASDPTGAGDAYRAGFIAAHVRGAAPEVAAKVGAAVASYAVECYGTQNHRFTLPDLKARYELAYQEPFPF